MGIAVDDLLARGVQMRGGFGCSTAGLYPRESGTGLLGLKKNYALRTPGGAREWIGVRSHHLRRTLWTVEVESLQLASGNKTQRAAIRGPE